MSSLEQPLSVIEKAVLRRVSAPGLPPGARVLDAPCGAGALAAALGEAGWEAWGADLKEEAQPLSGALSVALWQMTLEPGALD